MASWLFSQVMLLLAFMPAFMSQPNILSACSFLVTLIDFLGLWVALVQGGGAWADLYSGEEWTGVILDPSRPVPIPCQVQE